MPEGRISVTDDSTFRSQVEAISGQSILACYQCGECTAGCPVAYTADLMPNQVTRMVQLGQRDVLSSSMIWLCVGCETCATRCPKGVELSRVMDALREIADISREPKIRKFHEAFLGSVGHMGRVHEVSMLAVYKLRTLNFFSDIFLGIRMFFKGKLALMPKTISGTGEVRRIIADTKKR